MEPEIKKLKIEGVGPKTPEPSDSEEELPDIDAIRDHRKNKVKQEKEKRKEKEKRLQREFRCSLALFRAAEGKSFFLFNPCQKSDQLVVRFDFANNKARNEASRQKYYLF